MKNYKEKLNLFLNKIKKTNTSSIKISSKEKINLLEQLSNLLSSGIPLINSLQIIKYQTKNKKIKTIIENFIKQLNKGDSLSDIFKKYKNIFNIFDISIIEMGELTGKLGDSIETIKTKEEKSKELKGKIIGALIYPMVITCLSIAMIFVFMIYVIPKITDMYKDAKVNLPNLTQNVIDISNFIQNNIFLLIILIILIIFSIITFKNHPKTKIYFDKAVLNIPIFGPLIKKKILSLFANNLSILLKSGVIINKSLEISSKALENKYYEKELKSIIASVSRGNSLSSCMGIDDIANGKENFLFPIELASVIKIGEQTGRLAELLDKIGIKYNKQIDELVKNMQTAIEPIVIIVVGGIIGTLIMAIMLPFFNMVNVI